MPTDFDPLRAAREELLGLSQVLTAISLRENAAEERIASAEEELNAVRMLRAYAKQQCEQVRDKIRAIEAEQR
jgi:hypothetical protein